MSEPALTVKRTVLCFVVCLKSNRLLMIHKKRGQGAGKWNVPGGKIKEGETSMAAASRETQEETGILPGRLHLSGKLEFRFPEGGSWSNDCDVFITHSWKGELVRESGECSAEWVSLKKIPWDQMWESDPRWFPLVLSGELFHRRYTFDAKDRLIREESTKWCQATFGGGGAL
ncbi:MAG: 8-oxo-dGTP diphosphatase [Bdellovibrionales bacterium]|nr:8-oxo-dGTP diphosphatase [Bdellovibrionales bacterium]